MAKIRAKLKQLRDADVRYISLVDRAATRIPFRVLKRDKENEMGIDLTRVFKSDDTGKPFVSALVVFAQKDDKAAADVLEAIKKEGFKTDRVQKSDEGETLVFAQADKPKQEQVIRLSDQTLITLGGLKTPTGWIGEMATEHGFIPDLKTATDAMHAELAEIVTKSDNPQDDAEQVMSSYLSYLSQMMLVPAACYKLDAAITEIVKKCACGEEKTEKGELKTGNPASEALKEETADKRKRTANHPPSEMAPKDEEDDQKPPPDEALKADTTVLTMLKSIETTVTGLATKLEAVATEQVAQKKVLDGVVTKSDTLEEALKGTVTAAPVVEDRPAGTPKMRVAKGDDDPRTGNFDTAFLRKRR